MSIVRLKIEYSTCVQDAHNKKKQINQLEMVQSRATRQFTCNRYHNTSSVSDMLEHLQWPTLQLGHIQTRLIVFYKIIHLQQIYWYHLTIEQEINIPTIINKFGQRKTLINIHIVHKPSYSGTCYQHLQFSVLQKSFKVLFKFMWQPRMQMAGNSQHNDSVEI